MAIKRLVDVRIVEHEIISAIEDTDIDIDMDNKMGNQSAIWSKIYKALDQIAKQSVHVES